MNSSIMCLLFLFVFLLFVFHYHLKEVAPKWYGLHFHLTTEQPLHFWEKTQILWGLHKAGRPALQTGVEPPLYFTVPQLPILRSQILRSGGCLNILNHQAFPSVDFLFFFYSTGTFLDGNAASSSSNYKSDSGSMRYHFQI